ncbi:MAG TPA: TauD/TfdA family dioxygenase [Bacteroidia bacterium]|nr:TauD/TfdA family dioxygenase [Bacteroidia bacterium]
MISTNELFEKIRSINTSESGCFLHYNVDLDLKLFIDKVSEFTFFKIINSFEGPFTIIKDLGINSADYSKQSGFFDFHTDGLYNQNNIPSLVFLYCKTKGKQINHTTFIDGNSFSKLIVEKRSLLNKLSLVFVNRNGEDIENNLIQIHKWTNEILIILGDRAFIRPRKSIEAKEYPTLREISEITNKIFSIIKEGNKIIHTWENNDLLIFDNQRFLHSRQGKETDIERELIRICLDKKNY